MLGIGGSEDRARSIILFDVGASSIGVALGVSEKSGQRMLWYERIEYAYERADSYEHYTKAMFTTLLDAGMAVLNDGVRVAQRDPLFSVRHAEVACVLAPPWFFASVESAVKTSDKRRVITHGLLDELRGAMFTNVHKRPEYIAWQEVAGAGELLEQYDLLRFLDGYRIYDVREHEAQECALTTYMAVASQLVMRQVEEIVRKVLPNHQVRMHTSTHVLASYRARKKDPVSDREVLVEVGGQVTSVAVQDRGVLSGVATRPVGTHDFLRACAPKAQSIEEAMSRGVAVVRAAENDQAPLAPEVTEALGVWFEAVQDAVTSACGGVTPPTVAALAVRSVWYPLYANMLAAEWLQPGIRDMRAFTVVPCEESLSEEQGAPLGKNTDSHLYTLLCALTDVA